MPCLILGPGIPLAQSNLKDTRDHFLSRTKYLKPQSIEFDAGKTFKAVFDHLNLYRVTQTFDTSGFVGFPSSSKHDG